MRDTTCLFSLRIDADYREPRGGFAPVKVTYVWQEDGVEKRDVHVARQPEESYVIDWMYPYLEPYGIIMKINAEPLPTPNDNPDLWKNIIARDRSYWDKLTDEQYRRILGWVRVTQPEFVDRIKLYSEAVPLFERHGVDQAILSTLNKRVDLPLEILVQGEGAAGHQPGAEQGPRQQEPVDREDGARRAEDESGRRGQQDHRHDPWLGQREVVRGGFRRLGPLATTDPPETAHRKK